MLKKFCRRVLSYTAIYLYIVKSIANYGEISYNIFVKHISL